MHPPHSTVLRREKRKRDPYTADRQKRTFQLLHLISNQTFSFIPASVSLVTTWPRMDNDPPGSWNGGGSNSPTEVVGTSPEGCDLLETSTDSSVGYPRAPFASGRHARSTLPPNHLIPAHDSSPSARRYPPAGWWRRRRDPPGWGGPGALQEPPWKGVLRDPPGRGSGTPPKRGGAGILNNVNFGGFHRS